ncbi:hypothetical protein BJY00DRAFT_101062 [Aspergillus carlsbadensis]|nr:hypothetical protein BJY00DRAFT_101062 [Aspergillus carlsbadensis]
MRLTHAIKTVSPAFTSPHIQMHRSSQSINGNLLSPHMLTTAASDVGRSARVSSASCPMVMLMSVLDIIEERALLLPVRRRPKRNCTLHCTPAFGSPRLLSVVLLFLLRISRPCFLLIDLKSSDRDTNRGAGHWVPWKLRPCSTGSDCTGSETRTGKAWSVDSTVLTRR